MEFTWLTPLIGARVRYTVAPGHELFLRRNRRLCNGTVRDDLPTLKALLAAGASATLATSVYDGTALIAAAHLGQAGIVRELIRAGAPLDHVNNLGWTALIEAVVLGDGGTRHTETVRALLEAGADARIPDRNGATPLQLAQARGYGGMVSLLRKASDR